MSLLDKILNKKPEMIYSAIWQPEQLKTDYTGYEQPQAETQTPRKVVSFEALTGLKEKVKQVPTALENAIFGKQEVPEITTNADGTKAVTVNNNRNGGVLGFVNDFKEGFGENLTTPYSSENLLPQKKSLGERLGEGLGTATRFLDSPLGRGLAVAGAVGALGGGAGDALAYGLNTTAQNQGLRMQDRIYRDDLEKMGFDTTGIRGYINGDTYKNIISSQRAKNNRQNVGELAMLSPVIKKFVDANPALANVDIPASVANSLLKGDYTEAQIKAILSNIALNNVKADYYGSLTNVNKAALGEIEKGGGGVVVNPHPTPVVHNTNAF